MLLRDLKGAKTHEIYGTKKLYEDFKSNTVNVRCHSHDRNSSISSFIEKDKPNVIDCLDTWHAWKEVRKAITNVAKGAKKKPIEMGLGVLDWNEHVDRPVSSEKVFCRAAQTRNCAPERVLKPKTCSFVITLWDIYCNFLSGDIQPINICDNIQENNVEDDSILQESEDSENEESDDDIYL
ncbi:unnamed protein product [Mytilus coruscus]|uniref:Uncharacterized protein n=1 Tax=Mytilus coruscus TaxID=42192 RepID=A0A6J8A301_MYTCO|nr:unnamed protein product [Mytilus coruscus]